MLITSEGIPLQTTADQSTTVQYGGLVSQLASKTRTIVKEMDKKNELTCIRVQSTKFEVTTPLIIYFGSIILLFQLLVAPEDKYILIVQQDREKDADDGGEKPSSDSAT